MRWFAVVMLSLFLSSPLYATTLVSTGAPAGMFPFYNFGNDQPGFGIRFNLNSNYTISSFKGYFVDSAAPSGAPTAFITGSIYNGNANIPTGAPLYSVDFAANAGGSDFAPVWNGADNLSWNLSAGYYWLTFTVPDVTWDPDSGTPPPWWGGMPLNYSYNYDYAFYYSSHNYYSGITPGWHPVPIPQEGIAVQIMGDTWNGLQDPPTPTNSPVPEPGTVVLLTAGVLGLLALNRKR